MKLAPLLYLESLSAVALSIFKAAEGAQENHEGLQELATAVSDLLSVVSNIIQELQRANTKIPQHLESAQLFISDPSLDSHVEQLVQTLQKIDVWIKTVQLN
ncbi:hypothetical protein C8R42DRAFT_643011 [Lentinula raphanica]|nr:hypothetical protein C8R42DRAFT_643011 [Lentinula raphanica]